jgi:glycosyltransferase involved in cell wall biosynthesis
MKLRAPKRILFARSADANNFNAQAKNVQHILRHWQSCECRVAVFSFSAPEEGATANPNVDIIRITPDRLWRAKVFAAYMQRFDAVFCPGLHHYADWAALKARALLRWPLPIITTVEGLLGVDGDQAFDQKYSKVAGHPVYSQKIARAHWRRANGLFLMANHIIAVSPFLARQATAQYRTKVSMLSLGVDVALFRRTRWERRPRPRVVCAANVRAHKEPHVFLKLAARFPVADFVWFGDGELRAPLCEQAMKAGIGNLSFPGVLTPDALAREFAASDILVLPSRNEGVPKVTQEGAAAGLAQIIFGFYEAPSVVDGVNGFVVWREEEIADRLATLLGNPSLVERFGRAGTRMAEAWSWDIVAPQWEKLIVESVNGFSATCGEFGKAGSVYTL